MCNKIKILSITNHLKNICEYHPTYNLTFGEYYLNFPVYNFLIGVGLVLSFLYVINQSKKYCKELIGTKFIIITLASLLIGFLSASLINVFLFNTKISNIAKVGMTFYGGFVGLLFFLIISRMTFKNYIQIWNICIPTIPLTHAFGRIGCFFAGCCYGRYIELFNIQFRIPTQIISSIFLFILFFFLHKIKSTYKILLYLILYSLFRFMIEFFRGDIRSNFYNSFLSISQYISIVIFILSLIILAFIFLYKGKLILRRTL